MHFTIICYLPASMPLKEKCVYSNPRNIRRWNKFSLHLVISLLLKNKCYLKAIKKNVFKNERDFQLHKLNFFPLIILFLLKLQTILKVMVSVYSSIRLIFKRLEKGFQNLWRMKLVQVIWGLFFLLNCESKFFLQRKGISCEKNKFELEIALSTTNRLFKLMLIVL